MDHDKGLKKTLPKIIYKIDSLSIPPTNSIKVTKKVSAKKHTSTSYNQKSFIKKLLSNITHINNESDLENLSEKEVQFIDSIKKKANTTQENDNKTYYTEEKTGYTNDKNPNRCETYQMSFSSTKNLLYLSDYNSEEDEDYMPGADDIITNKPDEIYGIFTRSKARRKNTVPKTSPRKNCSPENPLREFKKYNYSLDELKYVVNLEKEQQQNIKLCEERLQKIRTSKLPIRFKIYNNNKISDCNKNNIIARINMLNKLDKTDNEYYKLSNWVNWLNKIPFGIIKEPKVDKNCGLDKITEFIMETKKTLDSAVYGHTEAKEKMLTIIAKIISSPESTGTCIAIQGPMGNGKTTLVKEGICKAMGRPFGFIPLGGMTDSNYMLGHDYTYEGSKPGRIVELLTECNCMNPIIYFDELDKISQSERGDEISNLLCHLTDTSQNDIFCDKYLSGIQIDLSKAIFIFSYNDPSLINPILLDRMYKIKTEGFGNDDKVKIAQEYLLPAILKEYNFEAGSIHINDEVIKNILSSFIEEEKGVRNLKRALETIISKLNLLRYIKNTEDIVNFKIKKFNLPFEVSQKHLGVLLTQNINDNSMSFLYS